MWDTIVIVCCGLRVDRIGCGDGFDVAWGR